jgi:nicotinamide mononucleotide transporter
MLDAAFTLLHTPVTWLEVLAFVLALATIACNVYEIHWGWPLTIVSSLLYAWLF